ncbi:hypothetical protein NQ176_g4648 [Zarea fungicola]|uniref:Uncharacterized protein n=1 Tax=Zarea fungicola TaxID=93591 RepID=A0ACC1NDK1_9HYPO|nr:hypothetical protein NQ176_g4648 [Lecanicillium fungicola]
MQFTTLFLALAAAVSVQATGINCEGNNLCDNPTFHLKDIVSAINSNIDTSRTYQNGEHIACQRNTAGSGICLFLQGTGGITGDLIKTLAQDIVNHGCKRCGSVPVFFDSGDNNISDHGELTANFVGNTGGCSGVC